MDFELTAEQAAARAMALDFARKEIAPHWRRREAEGVFHRDLLEKMGAAGMFGCLFPEEYGGSSLGFVAQVLVMEEMMRASIESGMPFNNQAVNVPMAIYRWGTEAQKRKYVPALIAAKTVGCFSLTEPGSGSDSAAMKTRAVRRGDRYVINGSKMWSTLGSVADLILLFAKTDPQGGHAGVSAFLVETKDLAGFSARAIPADIGTACIPSAELSFQDVEIPAESLLGGVEGQGFKVAMTTLHYGRVCVPARGLGIAQACLDMAGRLRQRARRLRTEDRRVPGRAAHHRRHAGQDRGGTLADLSCRSQGRPRPALRARGVDRQVLRRGSGDGRDREVSRAARRLWLRQGISGVPLLHLRTGDAHRRRLRQRAEEPAGHGRVGHQEDRSARRLSDAPHGNAGDRPAR